VCAGRQMATEDPAAADNRFSRPKVIPNSQGLVVHSCMFACVCARAEVYVCVCVDGWVCVIHTYTQPHVCIDIHTSIYMYIHIHTYIFVYAYAVQKSQYIANRLLALFRWNEAG